uniref:Uncharacterized protein n=1 Tax=Plectus sambesii TaxID=2011161 RepID=A0A914W480_9BILA
MPHILSEGERLAHCFGRHSPTEHHVVSNGTHTTTGRRGSLTDRAKEIAHDVAQMTMELAHEVKVKITGHITDKDVATAAKNVAHLQAKLADEQHQMRELESEAERAEKALELDEYDELKRKEIRLKDKERKTASEITEAEGYYWRLQDAQQKQKEE